MEDEDVDVSRYRILLDEVRQKFASVVWTHKIQEKQADIDAFSYKSCKTVNIVCSALTSCGIISTAYFSDTRVEIATALLSFVALFTAAYLRSFDLKESEISHKNAANKFVVIRDRLLHVIAELKMQDDFEKISDEYGAIVADLNELYSNAPGTTNLAVRRASKALKCNGEYSYSDEEIDCFLPSDLKGRNLKSCR